MHDEGVERKVCGAMVTEEVRGTKKVVIQKEHEVAPRCSDPIIPGGAWTAVGLFKDAQGALGFLTTQHLGSAVGRAIHDEDEFIIFRRKILCQQRRQGAFQGMPAVKCSRDDRELNCTHRFSGQRTFRKRQSLNEFLKAPEGLETGPSPCHSRCGPTGFMNT
jgi:hypothetical protein